MKKKNNFLVKLGAIVALLAIIASIIGTAFVFIFGSSETPYPGAEQISQEELQEYIDSLPEIENSGEDSGEGGDNIEVEETPVTEEIAN